MKVLVIAPALPPLQVGEAAHVLHLSQHLAERGLDVHIVTTTRDVITGNFPFKVYPLIRQWSWSGFLRLARVIRGCAPDAVLLIYSDWAYNDHFMIALAPILSKILVPGVTFVTQLEHEFYSFRLSLLTRAFFKVIRRWVGLSNVNYAFEILLRTSDHIIVLSLRHLQQLSESFAGMRSKSVVIPPPPLIYMSPEDNGAARQRGREVLGVRPDECLIAYFGYIYLTKGIEALLRAFQIICSQTNNARLLMIGGSISAPSHASYAQAIYELPKQLGIADKVIWTGEYAWDSSDASLYLRAADMCVLPFTTGVTLNRSSLSTAAAHALPIITTRGETLEAPFLDRQNVLLCPPNDPQSLAVGMNLLINNPVLRERLRTGAIELVHQWFSWDKAVDHTLEALQSSGQRGSAEA